MVGQPAYSGRRQLSDDRQTNVYRIQGRVMSLDITREHVRPHRRAVYLILSVSLLPIYGMALSQPFRVHMLSVK